MGRDKPGESTGSEGDNTHEVNSMARSPTASRALKMTSRFTSDELPMTASRQRCHPLPETSHPSPPLV